MALLAFDRSRLASLRITIGAALDDLHVIRSGDAAADDAMMAVRSAYRTLAEICLPRVQDILNSDAMTSYRRADVDGDDIHQALAYTMSNGYGWEVASDPIVDNRSVVTAEEARALGHRLQHGNLDRLIDHPQEAAFIAQQLAIITADHRLRAEFLANMTDLDRLADNFAVARLDLVTKLLWSGEDLDTWPMLQSIDATLADLTRLYQARPSVNHAGPYPAWVSDVEPFTAALLLRHAGLDPITLGHVTNDLLVRWRLSDPSDARRDGLWSDFHYDGPNTADILFQLMLDTPGACTVYVIDAAPNPASMWFSADDHRLAQRVALEGTDPANMKAADAGNVIKSFIDFSQSDRLLDAIYLVEGYPTDYAAFLGTLVAPWLLQFSPLNTDWAIDYTTKAQLLETVLDDDAGLAALTASHHAVVDGLRTSIRAGNATYTTSEHAALIGMLGQQIVNQRVRHEEDRLAVWNMWWNVASLPLAWLPVVPGIIADQLGGVARDVIADHGWLGAPAPDKVEDRGEYELEWMLTISGASMAIAAFNQLGLPPGTPPPPEPDPTAEHPQLQYEVDFMAWQKEVNDPFTERVAVWKAPFLSAAAAGKSLAD